MFSNARRPPFTNIPIYWLNISLSPYGCSWFQLVYWPIVQHSPLLVGNNNLMCLIHFEQAALLSSTSAASLGSSDRNMVLALLSCIRGFTMYKVLQHTSFVSHHFFKQRISLFLWQQRLLCRSWLSTISLFSVSFCDLASAQNSHIGASVHPVRRSTHLLSCECRTSSRDSSSLGRSSVNGGGR